MNIEPNVYVKELTNCYINSTLRGLKESAKWAAEMILSVDKGDQPEIQPEDVKGKGKKPKAVVTEGVNKTRTPSNNISDRQTLSNPTKWTGDKNYVSEEAASFTTDETATNQTTEESVMHPSVPVCMTEPLYMMAKSCFDCGEFIRAAHYSIQCSSKEGRFLHFYSRFMAAEKKKSDLSAEANTDSYLATPVTPSALKECKKIFTELKNEMEDMYYANKLDDDSYLYYVYALVQLKMEMEDNAMALLCRAIQLDYCNWAAWSLLSTLVDPHVENLPLPLHWMKKFFLGAVMSMNQQCEEAVDYYIANLLPLFPTSNYILAQIGLNKGMGSKVKEGINVFKMIQESDPYRLDGMDIYSNLLFVSDSRPKLALLAHSLNDLDPFRVETCVTIANFYSLRSDHQKAVVYLKRALKINSKTLSAWTLMGHEYMEMRNSGAAIAAYRSAIKANKRDHRAWYGLGQTYEIMKMYSYSLYYYTQARALRPNDPRMLIALGETYEKLDRTEDAIRCYDTCGMHALTKLAALYEKMNNKEKAAQLYCDFVSKNDSSSVSDQLTSNATCASELGLAYKFISQYHFDNGNYTESYKAAERCTMFPEVRDHGKTLITDIIKLQHETTQDTTANITSSSPNESMDSD